MTKKDWGGTAYLVRFVHYIDGHYHREPQAQITEHEIIKIGSKYLYFNSWSRYEIETGNEDIDYGDKGIVFPTLQAANEYIKRDELKKALHKYLCSTGILAAQKMPIEKLEQLLQIFTEVTP